MKSEFHDLEPHERQLAGSMVELGGRTLHDEVDRRIFWLVSRRLTPLGHASGGWDQLYRDPRDGRYWELTFPHGSLHGGGPRALTCVGAELAREKYGVPAD